MHIKRGNGFVFGIALIIIGALLLIMKFTDLSMNWQIIWPMIVIAVGLFLLAGVSKDRGVTFPATIVIGVGILFLIHNSGIMPYTFDVLWPFFPIIVGIAFIVLYFADKQDTGVLIPASILLAIGTIFLSINTKGVMLYVAPVIIIVVGILIISGGMFRKENARFHEHAFHDGRSRDTDGRQATESESTIGDEVPVDYINEEEESASSE